jgi:hypothetical protein
MFRLLFDYAGTTARFTRSGQLFVALRACHSP